MMVRVYLFTFDEYQNMTIRLNPTADAINAFQEREARKLKNEWHEGRGETCTPSQRLNRDILRALVEAFPVGNIPNWRRSNRDRTPQWIKDDKARFEHSIGGI